MTNDQEEKYRDHKSKEEEKIELNFLKGTKDKNLGLYCDIFSAKSGIEGQDGGVVTALLLKGFKEKIFETSIVIGCGIGYNAKVVEAKNPSDILAAKGTKYLKVNISQKLQELIKEGKKRIAVVCTPCEVKKVRKIQQILRNYCEIIIIGLFCFEAFNKTRLKEELRTRLGIDLDEAKKTQIRQGEFTINANGKEYCCKVKDLDQATEKICHYCDDFTAQFADISVGSVGSKNGYSTVIVRSKIGEKLIKNLDAINEAVEEEEIVRLSKCKRERAKKTITNLSNPK